MTAKRRSEIGAVAALLIALVLGAGWVINRLFLDRALGIAMDQRDSAAVVELLNRGAGVNVASPEQSTTPLIFILNYQRDLKLMKMLLARKANVDTQDKRGDFPLMSASSILPGEQPVLLQELLNHGAQVNQQGGGSTALMIATITDSTEAVKLLLKHGADPNLRHRHGDTALAMARTPEIIRLLEQAGGKK